MWNYKAGSSGEQEHQTTMTNTREDTRKSTKYKQQFKFKFNNTPLAPHKKEGTISAQFQISINQVIHVLSQFIHPAGMVATNKPLQNCKNIIVKDNWVA